MSDLTFNLMQAEVTCPPNAFVMVAGKAYLDIAVFIGEPVTDLSAPKVTELAIKLCRVGNSAQTSLNSTRTSGTRLNSFQTPTFSPPNLTTAGGIVARITCSVQGNMGVNDSDITPLLN